MTTVLSPFTPSWLSPPAPFNSPRRDELTGGGLVAIGVADRRSETIEVSKKVVWVTPPPTVVFQGHRKTCHRR